jgi:hypothetical protein
MLNAATTIISEHAGATIAGATSSVATLAVASQVPAPPGVPPWLPYLASMAGPILAWLGTKVLVALATRWRSIAAAKTARAQALRSDNDKSNDDEAAKLEAEADAAKAAADALDAARGVSRE